MSEIAKHIGQQVYHLRKAEGMSLRRLSSETGVSVTFLFQIEHAQSVPTADVLWKLSKGLKKPFGYWMNGFKEHEVAV